jgi:hypothetical protein
MSSDRFTRQRNRASGAKVLRENEAEQSSFKPQKCDFGVLHSENLGQNHAQIERRNSLAQNGSQGEKMLWKNDFFHHRVIVILSHRVIRSARSYVGLTDCIAFIAPSGTAQSNAINRPKAFIFNRNEILQAPCAKECDHGSSTQTITPLTVFVTLKVRVRRRPELAAFLPSRVHCKA